MSAFWHFLGRMLHYRTLVAIGIAAALAEAACAFAGFGALIWVIGQMFGTNETMRDVVAKNLTSGIGHAIVGDPATVTQWIPASKFGGFALALGVILALTLVGNALRIVHQMCAITAGLRTTMWIRKEAFQRLVHAPMQQVFTQGNADHLSRIVRDSGTLTSGFTALTAKALRDVLMGGVWLLIAFVINWKLTILFMVGLPLVYVALRKFGKRIRQATEYALKAYGWMVGAVQEALGGIAVVKVHTAEGYERRRFNTINRQVFAQEMKARLARATSSPLIEIIGIVGVMVVSLVAMWVGQDNSKQVGFVLFALAMAGVALRPLANLNNSIQEAAAAATRLDEVLKLPVEPGPRDGSEAERKPLPAHRKSIRFQSISYAYPGAERSAVEGIDLEAGHGDTVAIVGPNGSGKSTLLSLLPRLVEPTRGRVLIDGMDIAGVTLRSLRKQMAMVTQHTVLFEGTIADNIAYGRLDQLRDKIEAAAKSAHAHEFIAALPRGYDTQLGEGGGGLSGGQKQRLCIARAILRNPAILILDEATSQVDADSEAKINEALRELRQGRTTFVIAHRLSTVIDADLIAVMQDGRIVDRGTHQELLGRCEMYQMLTRTQLQPAEN